MTERTKEVNESIKQAIVEVRKEVVAIKQASITECSSDPCLNGGTCINGIGTYTCVCSPGSTGATCSECKPHFTGATCSECKPQFTGATCLECNPRFTGATCSECKGYLTGPNCLHCGLLFTVADCSQCLRPFTGQKCATPTGLRPMKPYGSSHYVIKSTSKTWASAREFCRNLGGDLVAFETDSEWNHVYTEVRRVDGWNNFWLRGKKTGGVWRWPSYRQNTDYGTAITMGRAAWKERQLYSQATCLAMNYAHYPRTDSWYYKPCGDTRYVLCEFE